MKRLGLARASMILAAMAVSFAAALCSPAAAADPPPKITKEDIAKGMKDGPGVITQIGLTCTLTNARSIGQLNLPADPKTPGSKAHPVDAYEFACKEGLGYTVLVDKPKSTIIDCLTAQGQAVLGCRLPENADPKAGLSPMVAETGRTCEVVSAKALGAAPDGTHFYEVGCKAGDGYVLRKEPGKATAAFTCMSMTDSKLACTLTTPDQNKAFAKGLAAGTKKTCAVTDIRFVGSTTSGMDGYEAACADTGYIFTVDLTGAVKQTVDCALAANFLGGCKLTDATKVETAEAKLYSDLSKKAGFDCTVAKYRLIGVMAGNTDLVEIACSNRPDGGVGAFAEDPTKTKIYDCLQVGGLGQECKLGTTLQPVLAKLSAGLASKGKGSCVVSSARYIGDTDDGSSVIETACSDGGLGWVMKTTPAYAVQTLVPCAAASGSNACKLTSNLKK